MAAIVPIAIVLFVVLVVAGMYNRLVRIRNHCEEAWHNIDTELKRRYDLIPNLVACVKGYTEHEKGLLEQVTRMREECVHNVGTPAEQAETENRLVRGLMALHARIEAYPDLKASANYLQLQEELVNTEDRIQAARRFYNGNVRENNNLVEMFPTSLIAGAFGFQRREFFEVQDSRERAAPQVGLG